MELNRRDALIALGGLGLTTVAWLDRVNVDESPLSEREVEILVNIGAVIYPTEVEVTPEFVRTYVVGQQKLDPEQPGAIRRSLERLAVESRRHTGNAIGDLSREQLDAVLRNTGAANALPNPDGTDAEQIRYYIVNNLLYALYTTPKGGELVGNPNPPGYPGGTEAYRDGEDDE